MTKHGYTSAAAVPAEPPAEVLTSAWLLEKQEADAVKIRQENVEIEREEAEAKAKGMIRSASPPRGPGPYTCPSCGTRPWHPLTDNLCDRCGLQVALKKVGKMLVARCQQKNKKEKADSDDNDDDDDDAPKPGMSNRAKKAADKRRGQPRQCPKCNKKTWEHMPLGTCESCGMREALRKSWSACHSERRPRESARQRQNNQPSHLIRSDPRQTAASSSWQAPQLQAPWRYEPPPGLSASSSSQAPSGIIRTTSRHNKIPGTHSSAS